MYRENILMIGDDVHAITNSSYTYRKPGGNNYKVKSANVLSKPKTYSVQSSA